MADWTVSLADCKPQRLMCYFSEIQAHATAKVFSSTFSETPQSFRPCQCCCLCGKALPPSYKCEVPPGCPFSPSSPQASRICNALVHPGSTLPCWCCLLSAPWFSRYSQQSRAFAPPDAWAKPYCSWPPRTALGRQLPLVAKGTQPTAQSPAT